MRIWLLTIFVGWFLHDMSNSPQTGPETSEAGCLEVRHFRPMSLTEYLESGQTSFPPTVSGCSSLTSQELPGKVEVLPKTMLWIQMMYLLIIIPVTLAQKKESA